MRWMPVPGFEGLYEISECGEVLIVKTGKIMKSRISKSGYLGLHLFKNGKHYNFRINRLVLMAFCGLPIGEKNEAAHIDGNKCNNNISNLRWASRLENENDKRIHKTRPIGRNHPMAILNENDALKIRELRSFGRKNVDLAKMYGVTTSCISKIVTNKIWRIAQ